MKRASDKNRGHYISDSGGVPLTSLMDAMTIILLFLLQSFSTSGNLIKKDPDSALALSTSTKRALSMPVIVISRSEIKYKDNPLSGTKSEWITPISEKIIYDSTIVHIQSLTAPLKEKAELLDKREKALRDAEIEEGTIREQVKRNLLIEIDKDTPYGLITKVMNTCGMYGFSDLDLITIGQ